jgi:hypothetical protein
MLDSPEQNHRQQTLSEETPAEGTKKASCDYTAGFIKPVPELFCGTVA